MGDVVNLKPANLAENHEFVADCCRFQESILTEANMKLKWGFADHVWQDLGSNESLLAAVDQEKLARVRSGRQKRERAQHLVVMAPVVAASIMNRADANDRHRLDACKVLNDLSANPQEAGAPAMDRFVITINLNGDVEHYNKSISINADDVVPNDGSAARSMPLPMADKRWDSDEADSNDVVAARAQKNTKAIERETSRVEKTPQQVALESMMNWGWD